MKIKPTKSGNVVVELERRDDSLLEQGDQASELGHLRKILVPVDFSPNARKAVSFASAFARQFSAELTFLHVVQVNYAYGEFGAIDFSALEREMRSSATKELAELVAQAQKDGIRVHSLIREGSPAKMIADVARELGSDLVVVSTHGYTGLKHVLMGSIAEHVVRYAPCPVLVVRQPQEPVAGRSTRDLTAD